MPPPIHPPTLAGEDATRKGRIIASLARAMGLVAALAFLTSLFGPGNDALVSLVFYSPIFVVLGGISWLARRGSIQLAAWGVSLFLWCLIALVTLLFGGLQGGNASPFAVSVLLIGVVVGGREALALAFASASWCALVGVLEHTGRLPTPLGPYSPLNAWTGLAVTLVLTSVLVHTALTSLHEMYEREQAASHARDEALLRAIQAQKMELVGTLSSGIAHDFNNLLAVITSASAALRDQHGADAESRETIDDLDAASTRALQMTRQLLAFGRTTTTELAPVDLGALVTATAAMLPRLLGRGVRFEVVSDPGCVMTAAPAGLEQVVLNLAVNARDAMPAGGTFQLTVRRRDALILLCATDSGVGMDAATQARIFEPFYTTKATGTGLGLATVRELVARYAGTIELRSEPGRGTTFELRFPASSEAVAP